MAGLLVILTALVLGVYLTKKFLDDTHNKDIARTMYTAIGVCSAGVIYRLFYLPYGEFVYLTSCITSTSLLLVSLLMFIRNLKSELFQYPYYMVFTPLILPISYILIYDVVILRDILLTSIGIVPMLVVVILIDHYKKEARTGTSSLALMGILSLVLLNRNLAVFQVQLPDLELIIIGAGGLALLYLFLKTFENERLNQIPK